MDALPPAIRARLFPHEELRNPSGTAPARTTGARTGSFPDAAKFAAPAVSARIAGNSGATASAPTFTSQAPALTTRGVRAPGGWDTPVDPLQLVWQHGLERDDFEGF